MLLLQYDELCVCELTYAIGASQPHVSRHLAQLRALGVIVDRREGLWIYYRINPSNPEWVSDILNATGKGLIRKKPFCDDQRTLAKMPNRPGAPRCA